MIYIELFIKFFIIGLFSIGGGLATLPLLHEATLEHNWLTEKEFIDMIAVSESTPGPIGINMSTYVGFSAANILGGIIATLGIVTPSIIIIVIIAHYFMKFNESPLVKTIFNVVRPVVTGLIAAAGFSIVKITLLNLDHNNGYNNIFEYFNIKAILLFIFIFYILYKYKKHPVFYIFIGAVLGVVFRL